MERVKIKQMYWDNIYLHMQLNQPIDEKAQYFVRGKNDYYELRKNQNEIILPIVNLKETMLLKNGTYYFSMMKDNVETLIGIEAECGYQLVNLDKVYRYGAEIYAYIVTFGIKEVGAISFWDEEGEDMIPFIKPTYMMKNKSNDKRNILVEAKNLLQLFKKAGFIVVKRLIQWLYLFVSLFAFKDGKHILLMSETRIPIGGNLKALDDRLKERGLDKEYHISYSFSKTLQQSKFKTFFTWSRLVWLIAKADYIFVDDYVPIFKTITPRKNTTLVQLWHAGVGFKSVGYSRFGRDGSPHPTDSCHRRYDYALCGAEGLIHVYEEVFGIQENQFLPYGLPRLDGYMDEAKISAYREQFYASYPQFKNKKIVMFAPTYRGATQDKAYYPFDKIDMDALYETLQDEYIFMFKMHPFIQQKVEIPLQYQDKIVDFSQGFDINELFYVTEVLITDFSSNLYEFALHRKPMIFYAFDKDYYQLTRGVHRTLDDAPGNVCETFEEVLDVLKHHSFDLQKLETFIKDSFPQESGNASDRLINEVILRKEKKL